MPSLLRSLAAPPGRSSPALRLLRTATSPAGLLRVGALLVLTGALAAESRADQTINSAGGTSAANGLRIYANSNTQIQIWRRGSGQVYSPNSTTSSSSLYNTVAMAVGTSVYNSRCGACTGGTAWTTVTQTGVTGSGTAADPYTVVTVVSAGATGITLTETIEYEYPEEYFIVTLDLDVPTTNTSTIKLYHLIDTYLAGGDNGPAYVDSAVNPNVVGVYKNSTYEAYVGLGDPWDYYFSGNYATMHASMASGANLTNTLDYNVGTDNGIAVEWNRGVLHGPDSVRYAIAFTDGAFATADTDGDSVLDIIEGTTNDTDGDGLLDYLDVDDDGDTINTIDEDYDGNGSVQNDDPDGDGTIEYLDPNCDDDRDGYDGPRCGTGDDCDDTDATIHPGAPEICDGIDQDCDGVVDEGAVGSATWYADTDADTYGDPASAVEDCSRPVGYVSNADDCDDGDAAIYPGRAEICDGVDQDCDGSIDEGAIDATTSFADTDADGYGDPAVFSVDCDLPLGYVPNDRDCDDTAPGTYPGAAEIAYDGIDQDCDGADLVDVDGDGSVATWAGGTDCNDTDAAVHLGASEGADGVDGDCDGVVDEGTDWYDDDGDGTTEAGGDCDDGDATVNPAGTETIDADDEDCDGLIDEGTDAYDDDGDGVTEIGGDCNDGDTSVSPSRRETTDNGVDDDCDGIVDDGIPDPDADGYTADAGDCGAEDDTVYPGANELADGLDNDCDGVTDEGTSAYDNDGDGRSADAGDCDDSSATVSPGAIETVNGVDDDCDGVVDEGSDVYDDDGDGVSELGGDCDDALDTVHPGAEETADGADNDCDDTVDEGSDDLDADGYTTDEGDCDDLDGWSNPATAEVCDGVDNDCNDEVDEGCEEEDESSSSLPACGCQDSGSKAWMLLLLTPLARRRRGR